MLNSFPLLGSYEEVISVWARGKSRNQKSETNFFLSEETILRAIKKKTIRGAAIDGGSILLRSDRDFHHLYLNFSNRDSILELMRYLPSTTTIVADIIQSGESHQNLISVLETSNFELYRRLDRMARNPSELPLDSLKTSSEVAAITDASEILTHLEENFDRFSEQLPDLDEIEVALKFGEILVIKSEAQIAGFLYFERFRVTSTLRYWFVNPLFRELRIGGRLIRDYLSVHCPGQMSQLWVAIDNFNARKRYEHYGYEPRKLTDHVYMRRGNNEVSNS